LVEEVVTVGVNGSGIYSSLDGRTAEPRGRGTGTGREEEGGTDANTSLQTASPPHSTKIFLL
jgi:hypothetical protein